MIYVREQGRQQGWEHFASQFSSCCIFMDTLDCDCMSGIC